MSEPLQIVTYTPGDHSALCRFMSDLQDLERGGQVIAPLDRRWQLITSIIFWNWLNEATDKRSSRSYDDLVGFLIIVIESVDEGDVHLIERYRQYGVVTDLYVTEEARHQGVASVSSTPLKGTFAKQG